MRKLIGTFCVLLGIICLLCAVGLVLNNRFEDKNAGNISKSLLKEVKIAIKCDFTDDSSENEKPNEEQNKENFAEIPDSPTEEIPNEMAVIEVDGFKCIGILSIPVLNLELPILTDWSYEKLKSAPCHYYGSYFEKDFVIAGHNYYSHFAGLSELKVGDMVIFTDVNGTVHYYEVALLETLPKKATKEMIVSGFDLSLYTCTLGGDNRITVRCNTVDARN